MNKKHIFLRYLPLGIGVVLAIAVGIAVYLLKDLFQKPVQAKKQVQQITVIQPPPPPPPPPPEQKPPEPEPEPEKIEEPEPEPEPEQPEAEEAPPSEDLGVDAEGGAGGDAFGLMGKKGGRGLIGGGGGSAILWYGGQVKRLLEDQLHELLAETPARKSSYAVTLEIWVGTEGQVNRVELSGASGKQEVDQAIRAALTKLRVNIGKAPPGNMPQPLRVRLTSRI